MLRKYRSTVPAIILLLLLLFNSKTAYNGAMDGVEMCIRSLIPSLFPFIFLSVWMRSQISGFSIRILSPLGKLCGLPKGAESLFLLAVLGGYPVGAQLVHDAWRGGQLSDSAAKRMLGFCNVAGPSFIFGAMGRILPSMEMCWVLWGIQLLSAVITGAILPGNNYNQRYTAVKNRITLISALDPAIKTMVRICCWAVLFRIIIALSEAILTDNPQAPLWLVLRGLLEISNGCIGLTAVNDPSHMLILSAFMLAFGGICVYMQTASVTGALDCGMYLPGKLLQSTLAALLAMLSLPLLGLPLPSAYLIICLILAAIVVTFSLFLNRKKIIVAFCRKGMYNRPI